MATKATNSFGNKEFKLVPAGTHLARCYQFVHIGNVPNTFPTAKPGSKVNKIRLTWELPEELTTFKPENGEQPFSISQEYTLSMNEKANLRKIITSWLGKSFSDEEAADFDAELLVGMDCLLTINHVEKNGKTFPNIANITKLPSKMTCPAPVNTPSIITWEGMTQDKFLSLPTFLREKMRVSDEYKKYALENGIEEVAF